MRRNVFAWLSSALVSASFIACAGPPVPVAIDDETVCLDYQTSSKPDKMYGGMRVPVVITVLDGKTQVARDMVFGRREKDGPLTAVTLPDASTEYTVEWAQCANKRAERALSTGHDASYACGEAKVYKTEKLVTKRGEVANAKLKFPLPPDATCWIGDVMPTVGSAKPMAVPPPPEPAPPASASATPAPSHE